MWSTKKSAIALLRGEKLFDENGGVVRILLREKVATLHPLSLRIAARCRADHRLLRRTCRAGQLQPRDAASGSRFAWTLPCRRDRVRRRSLPRLDIPRRCRERELDHDKSRHTHREFLARRNRARKGCRTRPSARRADSFQEAGTFATAKSTASRSARSARLTGSTLRELESHRRQRDARLSWD